MRKRGFTLIEVILAISVLTLAVGGIFTLIQQTLVVASISNSKLTAAYLAQEGMEIVRNIRDNNWLYQKRVNPTISWKAGLTTGEYEASYDSQTLNFYTDRNLYINGDNGFYTYIDSPDSNDIQTKFKRKITITEIGENTIDVSVNVAWQNRGKDYNIEVRENLYNWGGY